MRGMLLDKHQALETFCRALDDPNIVITGANLAFDLMVAAVALARVGIDAMPAIFAALATGRCFDILIAEPLNAIARGHLGKDPRTGSSIKNPETGKQGSYSLSTVVDMVLNRVDAKSNDEWRLRYKELDGIPLDQWPQSARDYPIDDVCNAGEVALAQTGHLAQTSTRHRFTAESNGRVCGDCGSTTFSAPCITRRAHLNLHEVANQTYSAFVLHSGATWGLQVDQSAADIIERYARKRRAKLIPPFITAGILDPDDESENRSVLKRMIAIAYGARGACSHCHGTGKVPSRTIKTLRCTSCRGRCQPWKSAGTIKAPTVSECETCGNTGLIPHPKPNMINCITWDSPDEDADEVKTCDGSGIVLTNAVPRSDKGGIAYGRDALNESGDDFLMRYGDFLLDAKVLKDYIPFLRTARVPTAGHLAECPKFVTDDKGGKKSACICPGPYTSITMTLKPNAVLDTGRVSYRGYIMLLPRKPGFRDPDPDAIDKYIPSLRECFVARGQPTYRTIEVPDDYVLRPGEERIAC